MDTFAHAAWTYIIFSSTDSPLLAVLFGVMPDLLSWTIYLFYSIFTKGFSSFKRPNVLKVPKWMDFLYGITHSIFIFAATVLIVFLVTGSIPIFLWAWIIHIVIDIPMHSRDFLPTPFLWPFSDWKFPGFSWGQKWFVIANWTAIIIVGALVFF